MATDKRFTFSASDTGVSSLMEKMRRQSAQVYNDMLTDARKYNMTAKEQVTFINDQIRSLERRNQLDAQGAKQALALQRERALAQASSPEDKADVKAQYSSKARALTQSTQEDVMQTRMLRSIAQEDTQRQQEEQRNKLLASQEHQRYGDALINDGLNEQEDASAAEREFGSEVEDRDEARALMDRVRARREQQRRLGDDYEQGGVDESGADEGAADEEAPEQTNLLRQLVNLFSGSSRRQEEEQQEEDDEESSDESQARPKGKGGFFRNLFGGKDEFEDDEYGDDNPEEPGDPEQKPEKGSDRRRRDLLDRADARARQATNMATNPMAAVAAIPIIGGVLAFLGYQGNKLQQAGGQLEARTANDYKRYGSPNEYGVGNTTPFGVSRAEFMQYSLGMAPHRGSGRGLESEAFKLLASEKATGLNQGTLYGMEDNARYQKGGGSGADNYQDFIKALRQGGLIKGNDFSRMEELLQLNNKLTEHQGALLGNVSPAKIAGMIAGIGSWGGGFSGPQMGARVDTLNGALQNPGNDYKQAQEFAILRKRNPKATLSQLFEMQEQGLGQKGLLKDTMADLFKRAGGDQEQFIKQIKTRGLAGSWTDAHQMADRYRDNPGSFDLDGVYRRGQQRHGDMDMVGRGRALTPKIPKLTSKIEDVGATAGDKAIDFVDDQVNAIAAKGITEYSKESFRKMSDSVGTSMKEASKGMVQAVREEMRNVAKDMGKTIKSNIPFMHD